MADRFLDTSGIINQSDVTDVTDWLGMIGILLYESSTIIRIGCHPKLWAIDPETLKLKCHVSQWIIFSMDWSNATCLRWSQRCFCSLNLVVLVCGLECWGLPSESFESFRRDSMALQGFHMKIAAITGDSSLHSCLVRADRLAPFLFLSPKAWSPPSSHVMW